MKIYIPHPYRTGEEIYTANSGASVSGFNHARALARYCEVYMSAQESQQYEENIYGIPQTFETIGSSLAWFEQQSFDAVIMFEPNVDDLVFFRHVCPTPIIIRLSCCFGRNREFLNKVLNCYSLLRPYDVLSPKSQWCAEELSKYVFDTSYLKPITNGVDLETFKPSDKLNAKKQLAEITGDSRFVEMPVVGLCSRFEPGKGAYPFLRAADLNPNVLFAVIGKQYAPVTHPLNVVFLGPQSYTQMPLFYNALDVLCALSVYSYESCPSVVLEGMACGLPIVTTQFAGAPELLDDCGRLIEIDRFENEPLNVTGYIDPEMVSKTICELLSSKTERLKLGCRARKRAGSFSWDNIAKQHVSLIESLLNKRDQPACSVPLTVHFSQTCDSEGNIKSIPRAFNFFGRQQGPLPRISFLGQDMTFLEGFGLYLSQMLHPNEVEAAMIGVCGDGDTAYKVLRKIRRFSDMLTAP